MAFTRTTLFQMLLSVAVVALIVAGYFYWRGPTPDYQNHRGICVYVLKSTPTRLEIDVRSGRMASPKTTVELYEPVFSATRRGATIPAEVIADEDNAALSHVALDLAPDTAEAVLVLLTSTGYIYEILPRFQGAENALATVDFQSVLYYASRQFEYDLESLRPLLGHVHQLWRPTWRSETDASTGVPQPSVLPVAEEGIFMNVLSLLPQEMRTYPEGGPHVVARYTVEKRELGSYTGGHGAFQHVHHWELYDVTRVPAHRIDSFEVRGLYNPPKLHEGSYYGPHPFDQSATRIVASVQKYWEAL